MDKGGTRRSLLGAGSILNLEVYTHMGKFINYTLRLDTFTYICKCISMYISLEGRKLVFGH